MPRVISITMVKNEQDIIEPFVYHNKQFVDSMIIIDNGSTDETRNILRSLMREVPGIVLADISGLAFVQQERITRLLHYCQTAYFADFIVFLDADEFIRAKSRDAFVQSLSVIPKGGYGLVPWRTFVLTPDSIATAMQDAPNTFRYRRTEEAPVYFKAILRADGEPCTDLIVAQGSHSLSSRDGKALLHKHLNGVELAHFPVRNPAQLTAKSIIGWMAMLARNRNWDGASYQWRDNFESLCRGVTPEGERLCEASMRYAQERLVIDWSRDVTADSPQFAYTRRYSNGSFADPLVLVAKAWERELLPRVPFLTQMRPQARDLLNEFVDVPPFRWVAEKYMPSSVLDLGCGVGSYLALMERFGADTILGVDRIPVGATALNTDQYAMRDLSERLDLKRVFDLVVCTEVIEHLPEVDADVLLSNIARHANNLIVFSAAEPDQLGKETLNCRPIGDWLRRWQALGWLPDLHESLAMRALSTFSWFRRNLVVLRRDATSNDADAAQTLERIGHKSFVWYRQAAAVKEEMCTEDLPQDAGYVIHGGWRRIFDQLVKRG